MPSVQQRKANHNKHLRDTAGQIVFRNTVLAVSAEDLTFAEKLDGIPQSVSGGTADKAASELVLIPHSGTPSKTVQSLDLLHFQYSIEHIVYPARNH